MWVLIYLQILSETFVILTRNKRDIIINVHRSYSCQILIKHDFPQQIFKKSTNMKFHENPSSGSRVVPCGRTDMVKLIAAFHNFANAPKNYSRFADFFLPLRR
jgi:hypothetical protein